MLRALLSFVVLWASFICLLYACDEEGSGFTPIGGTENPADPATGSNGSNGNGTVNNLPSGIVPCAVAGSAQTLATVQGTELRGVGISSDVGGYAVGYIPGLSPGLGFARFNTEGAEAAVPVILDHDALVVESPALTTSSGAVLYGFVSDGQFLAREPGTLVDNSISLGVQTARSPVLTSLSGGQFLAAWTEPPSLGESRRLYYAVLNVGGSRATAPTQLVDVDGISTLAFAKRSSGSAAGTALVYVVPGATTGFDIKLRTVTDAGVVSSTEHTVVAEQSIVGRPAAARLSDGGTLVAWAQLVGLNPEVHVLQVEDNGSTPSQEYVINDAETLEQSSDPALVYLQDSVVLVYRSERQEAGETLSQIRTLLLQPFGTPPEGAEPQDLVAANSNVAPLEIAASDDFGFFGLVWMEIDGSNTTSRFAALNCLSEI